VIRVLIVDDSATVRRVLSEELSKYPDIEVVGTAVDPYVARDRIIELKPDVVTLDVEMPRMDGISFLAKLMKHHPLPVVVVSSLTQDNSELALRALQLGAVEVVPKPGSVYSTPDVEKRLIRAIRAAAVANVAERKAQPVVERPLASLVRSMNTTDKVIAMGASTGGTKALEAVLAQMPAAAPATVIVQHMPAAFIDKFVQRLDQVSPMQVRVARDNDDLAAGVALVSPHGQHMLVQRSGARYLVRLKDGPAVHYQKPSVDVLFNSVAQSAGGNAIGVLMTGMGADGAKGLLAMREAGAFTIAESEQTAIVFGMPKEAIALDAATEVQRLDAIPRTILRALGKKTEPVARPAVAR
jgi:two-component system, chemotaxis family, protein-glutamate methylesterase/glutaminase